MKIAIRMDDITPDMDWEKFDFFKSLFEEAGVTPLLGIVPCNCDDNLHISEPREDFWDRMRALEKKGYVLAVHGCHHVYSTSKGGMFPLNNFSEFAGRSYEEQKADLQKATDILREHGVDTDIFMAPAHSYDKNTLRALKELGYTKMTDGFGSAPYIWNDMTFYPISFLLSRSLKKSSGYTTMVIHSNTVSESEKDKYRELFAKYGKDMISYTEYLKAAPQKRTIFGRIGEYFMAKGKFILVRIRK